MIKKLLFFLVYNFSVFSMENNVNLFENVEYSLESPVKINLPIHNHLFDQSTSKRKDNFQCSDIVYESEEEVTLTLKKNLKTATTLEEIIRKTAFDKNNSFDVGDFVILKNGLLTALNLKAELGIKIVCINKKDAENKEYSFTIVTQRDADGNPLSMREITIKDPELLGKISHEHLQELLDQ